MDRASFFKSPLGLRQARVGFAMNDEDYVAWGKGANSEEFTTSDSPELFRLLEADEGLDEVFEVPFALKHVRDVLAVMRLSVAVAGERSEELVRHPMFHPVFAAFTLGFCMSLAACHRAAHAGVRRPSRLARRQLELCEAWGIEIATHYLAVVESDGVFGKDADAELYGIDDRWRLLGDERRFARFDRLSDCVEAGRRAAESWSADEGADVAPFFLDTLSSFVAAHPDAKFE